METYNRVFTERRDCQMMDNEIVKAFEKGDGRNKTRDEHHFYRKNLSGKKSSNNVYTDVWACL